MKLNLTICSVPSLTSLWQQPLEKTYITLLLATKTQNSLTRFTGIRLVKQEDFSGAIALTYFVENCL